MSEEFIMRLALMAQSRPPVRSAHGRSDVQPLALRTGMGGVEMKVDGNQTTEGTKAGYASAASSSLDTTKNSCADCEETRCHRHIFPLMSLPTELRLQIYRLCLARDTPVQLHIAKPKIIKPEDAIEEKRDRYQRHAEVDGCTGRITIRSRGTRTPSQTDQTRDCDNRNTDLVCRGPAHEDTLISNILLVSKQIHSEARPVLYSENNFVLQLDSAVYTLTKLRQQCRSLIKHVSLTVPSHHHVLEGFADLVRLGLRYCWGLQTFTIALPTFLPRDTQAGTNGTNGTNVYANAFHILRWLPQNTKVVLDGGATADIRLVVEENRRMARDLDTTSYLKRQHQMPERV
ncbi:hypothetical protein E2P81_ATG08216 [Venturia nashicola]|uniref:DUF7730 domain-containing protein n=1 Tax=Venturia nashicola TaxID=86259 RepID=A0A4Z1NQ57_9PEZI|nr:hypothetical protein E6O75_ATG08398 [Venturia nashicola]TLD21628.1 hypothetical protein E2P81_ATG08216 [Venturia nashicola]